MLHSTDENTPCQSASASLPPPRERCLCSLAFVAGTIHATTRQYILSISLRFSASSAGTLPCLLAFVAGTINHQNSGTLSLLPCVPCENDLPPSKLLLTLRIRRIINCTCIHLFSLRRNGHHFINARYFILR